MVRPMVNIRGMWVKVPGQRMLVAKSIGTRPAPGNIMFMLMTLVMDMRVLVLCG